MKKYLINGSTRNDFVGDEFVGNDYFVSLATEKLHRVKLAKYCSISDKTPERVPSWFSKTDEYDFVEYTGVNIDDIYIFKTVHEGDECVFCGVVDYDDRYTQYFDKYSFFYSSEKNLMQLRSSGGKCVVAVLMGAREKSVKRVMGKLEQLLITTG